jgi:hypothetical protein
VVTALALILLGALATVRRVPGADRLHRAVYTSALSAGHIATNHRPSRPTAHSTVLTGARS